MLTYQLKIEIKPYKPDEFVNSMRSFLRRIRKEKGDRSQVQGSTFRVRDMDKIEDPKSL